MRLNKKSQSAILFCLYLSRSGRTSVASASEGLSLSRAALYGIAAMLKKAGLVTSVRGRNGGYELVPNATILNALNATTPPSVLAQRDAVRLAKGSPEARALVFYAKNLVWQMGPMLQLSIRDVMQDLVDTEVKHLNRLDINGLEQ